MQLTRLRQARGWSKSELGRRSGVNQVTISVIEARRLAPYASQMRKLAQALDYEGDPAELLGEMEDHDRN